MGIMTNRNVCRLELILVLAFVVVLAGFRPGLAEDQEIKQLRQAAAQGDARAQLALGRMYATGDGMQENLVEAATWTRQAADRGHARAQTALGFLHRFGRGVLENHQEAVKWNRMAAEQGQATALLTLGDMYVKGEGVLEDYVHAYAWYILAATQGKEQAFKLKGDLRPMMSTEQVAEAHKLSATLWERIESSKAKKPILLPKRQSIFRSAARAGPARIAPPLTGAGPGPAA
jgi:TPR repeat protein